MKVRTRTGPDVAPAGTRGEGPGTISVNGQRENSNGFLVNGGDVSGAANFEAGVQPGHFEQVRDDLIQPFRLICNALDQFMPVDVYVPGCPPRPETLIEGIMAIQRIIDSDGLPPSGKRRPLQLAVEPDYKPAPQPMSVPVTVGGRPL